MARRGDPRPVTELTDDELVTARIDAEGVAAQAMSDGNRRLHDSARRDLIAITEEEARRTKAEQPDGPLFCDLCGTPAPSSVDGSEPYECRGCGRTLRRGKASRPGMEW